jgi:hypothetical protein
MTVIQKIQSIFDNFQNSDSIHHGFIIGSGNHWSSIVLHKFKNEIEVFYLDSRNLKVLGVSDDYLMEEVKSRLKFVQQLNSKKIYTQEDNNNYIDGFYNSLKDIQYSINLFYKCAIGEKPFISEALRLSILCVLETYEKIVHSSPTKEEELRDFFLNYFHPAIIKDNINNMILSAGVQYLEESMKWKLMDWMNEIEKLKIENDLVERLRQVLKELKDILCKEK